MTNLGPALAHVKTATCEEVIREHLENETAYVCVMS